MAVHDIIQTKISQSSSNLNINKRIAGQNFGSARALPALPLASSLVRSQNSQKIVGNNSFQKGSVVFPELQRKSKSMSFSDKTFRVGSSLVLSSFLSLASLQNGHYSEKKEIPKLVTLW